MQHWHVYQVSFSMCSFALSIMSSNTHFLPCQKWNERLYKEMYEAFKNGRAAENSANSCFRGEIASFDFYVIPLVSDILCQCACLALKTHAHPRLKYRLRNYRSAKYLVCQAMNS
jgi:hypothetical protein